MNFAVADATDCYYVMGNRATQLKGRESSSVITDISDQHVLKPKSQLLKAFCNLASVDVRMCSKQLRAPIENHTDSCDEISLEKESGNEKTVSSEIQHNSRLVSSSTSAVLPVDHFGQLFAEYPSSAKLGASGLQYHSGSTVCESKPCISANQSSALSSNAAVVSNSQQWLEQLRLINSQSKVVNMNLKDNVVSRCYQIISSDDTTKVTALSDESANIPFNSASCNAISSSATNAALCTSTSAVGSNFTVKKNISTEMSGAITDCSVHLDRLPCGDYMDIQFNSVKRAKLRADSEIHEKNIVQSSDMIAKNKFYSSDESVSSLKSPRRRRKILPSSSEPVAVIHIDHDDNDDIENSTLKQSFTVERSYNLQLTSNIHSKEEDSCDLRASINVDTLTFRGNSWHSTKAYFYQQKVELHSESRSLTLRLCDMISIECTPESALSKLNKIRVRVKPSFMSDFFLADTETITGDDMVLHAYITTDKYDSVMTAILILSSQLPETDELLAHHSSTLHSQPYNEFVMSHDAPKSDTKLYGADKCVIECRRPLHTQDNSTSNCSRSAALDALHEYDDCDQSDTVIDQDHNINRRSEAIVVSNCFAGDIVRLFTYPPPPAVGGITMTNEDLFCLNDGEYLNDVIIEFYIKYLYAEILTTSERARTHIFNTFFYGQLTKECKETSGHSIQQKRHSQVKRWTKHVDLFSKDFIIIPINEDSHWFLAVICFPYLVGIKPSSATKNKFSALSRAAGQSIHQSKEEMTKVDMNYRHPCILIFNSLKCASNQWTVAVILREYLQIEWDLKKSPVEGRRLFEKSTMKGATPGCPQQTNSSDCGIYVLHYIENFFKRPLSDFTLPIRYLSEWFPQTEIYTKRHKIRHLIIEKINELNPALDYNLAQDGCDV